MEHIRLRIDHDVIVHRANTGKLFCYLFSYSFFLSVMYCTTQADNTEAWIDTYGQITCTLITAKYHSKVSSKFIVTNQAILDLKQTRHTSSLVFHNLASQ